MEAGERQPTNLPFNLYLIYFSLNCNLFPVFSCGSLACWDLFQVRSAAPPDPWYENFSQKKSIRIFTQKCLNFFRNLLIVSYHKIITIERIKYELCNLNWICSGNSWCNDIPTSSSSYNKNQRYQRTIIAHLYSSYSQQFTLGNLWSFDK